MFKIKIFPKKHGFQFFVVLQRICLCRQGSCWVCCLVIFISILGDYQHFVIKLVSYAFVQSSTESMFCLSVFLQLVTLTTAKLVLRTPAFLLFFLVWVCTCPFFLRGRKEEKLYFNMNGYEAAIFPARYKALIF